MRWLVPPKVDRRRLRPGRRTTGRTTDAGRRRRVGSEDPAAAGEKTAPALVWTRCPPRAASRRGERVPPRDGAATKIGRLVRGVVLTHRMAPSCASPNVRARERGSPVLTLRPRGRVTQRGPSGGTRCDGERAEASRRRSYHMVAAGRRRGGVRLAVVLILRRRRAPAAPARSETATAAKPVRRAGNGDRPAKSGRPTGSASPGATRSTATRDDRQNAYPKPWLRQRPEPQLRHKRGSDDDKINDEQTSEMQSASPKKYVL